MNSSLQMRKRRLSMAMAVLCGLGLCLPGADARAEKIPAMCKVSPKLSKEEQKTFSQKGMELDAALAAFKAASEPFNKKPAKDQSDEEYAAIMARRAQYIAAVQKYNAEMAVRVAAAERLRIIQAMSACVHRLDWSEPQKARVDAALNKLGFDGDPNATSAKIKEAWNHILERDPANGFAKAAAQGAGPGFPGAGTQSHQDCAVFALANAAGLPYGLVAARAAELLRQAEWRPAAERAAPGETISRSGLNGGEVIILAEAFGRVQVISSKAFAATLKEGHLVLINVSPASGDVDSGHEVVLSRTFQHAGEIWYEMMDSNQPPEKRLYLSSWELGIILQENGVVFRPEKDKTPKSLKSAPEIQR